MKIIETIQARERESSEQRDLRLQTRRVRQRQRRQQETSEQRQHLDRLRTRNRSVAQDLLMHAMMIKSFLSMWRTVIFPGRTVSQM